MTDSNADLQKSFGELRSAAHALTGDERWTALCELLHDWPQPHLQEVVLPYLEEVLRDDTSARLAPERWLRVRRDQLNIHPAALLARSCVHCEGDPKRLNLLVSSPLIQNLTSLDLYDSQVGVEGANALASSPYLQNLTALYLGDNNLGDEGAATIANSPYPADAIRTPWMS
jgi:hypothetical protein